MSDSRSLMPGQTKLPQPSFELRMPDGTPFGLGFLGAARFSAIKRVMERADRAYRAAAGLIDARSEVNNALIRHAATMEQLERIDQIRDQVAERIDMESLRLRLERMELEDQIAAKEIARAKVRSAMQPVPPPAPEALPAKPDKWAAFLSDLKRMPEIAKAAASVKAEIIKDAGGEEKLDDATRRVVETIDVLLTAFAQKQAEDTIL